MFTKNTKLTSEQLEFMKLEYSSLKSEIIERMKLVRQTETFCITGAGLLWTFSFSALRTEQINRLSFIWISASYALIILALAYVTAFDREGVYYIGKYIKNSYEDKFKSPGIEGWETDTISRLEKRYNSKYWWLSRHSLYFGTVIIINWAIGTWSAYEAIKNCSCSWYMNQELYGFLILSAISVIALFIVKKIVNAGRILTSVNNNQVLTNQKLN